MPIFFFKIVYKTSRIFIKTWIWIPINIASKCWIRIRNSDSLALLAFYSENLPYLLFLVQKLKRKYFLENHHTLTSVGFGMFSCQCSHIRTATIPTYYKLI